MNVTSARYFSTNTSLPPQYQSEDEWILRPEHVEDWDALIVAVLDRTTVNGEMTVRQHAKALAQDDADTLKRLEPEPGGARPEPAGAPTVTFTLLDGDDVVYRFRTKLDYDGKYAEFVSIIKAKGSFSDGRTPERPTNAQDAED